MNQYFYQDKKKAPPYLAVPLFLMEAPYKTLSPGAKLLYGAMLRRVDLSRKSGWLDEQGRVYQFFPIAEVMAFLDCCKQKAVNTLRELEGADLLERKNQGRGKPSTVLLKSPQVSCKGDKPRSIYEEALDYNSIF